MRDGSKTMMVLRLKVINGAITEIEKASSATRAKRGYWGNPDSLTTVSPRLTLSIREAERDS